MSSPQTSSSTTYTLSEHDKRIANILLYSGGELAFTPQSHDQVMETTHVSTQSIKAELLEELKALERKGVERAEAGDVTDAVALFTKAIDMAPNYASAYNNRAQARRLQGDLDGAMEDLEYAIRYAGNDAAILKQAYTQRGMIHKSRGNTDAAFKDFECGAHYGNPVAKEAAVLENPYAKMCNAMMLETMRQLYS